MYQLLKKFLFILDPEKAHFIALKSLQLAQQLGLTRLFAQVPDKPCTIMGLRFPNQIGLAAGLDKNGDYIDALAALGFGFIEIGTITPKAQAGNPLPRLFRLREHEALINRMGFNNKGVKYAKRRLEKMRYRGILGINIGKNKDTPNANAIEDYLFGFRELAKFASYITINISSPNTEALRDLQQSAALSGLLAALKAEQKTLAAAQHKYTPLVVKIAPDMSAEEVRALAAILLQYQIDGVIATNTTTSRAEVKDSLYANEKGGLSGKPLRARSTLIVKQLYAVLQDRIPIIASGGIVDKQSAQEKLASGAKLLQLYTGLIYQGPSIISQLT
jgi:dihydroorotate dehydrogenase